MKLHVLLNKSEIKKERLDDKILIVLDILVATSSIVTALANGCKQIHPVRNYQEAIDLQQQDEFKGYFYSGELNANTLDGFIQPTPIALIKADLAQKNLVYCTTNGTVALNESKLAHKVFAGSLLNAQALVKHVLDINSDQKTVLIVCSGSHDQFNLEDYYGAGCFVENFLKLHSKVELTDTARAARLVFQSGSALDILNSSRVGQMLIDRAWHQEIAFIAQQDIYPVIPELHKDGKVRLHSSSFA